jgi:hypothetical protein
VAHPSRILRRVGRDAARSAGFDLKKFKAKTKARGTVEERPLRAA